MVDLELLIRFAAVAEDLSFSGAARRLGVDQPRLSRQIRALEGQLGFRLFTRNTRRVALTDEGGMLLKIAHEVSAVGERAQAAVQMMVREHDTTIRFGTHPYVYWSPILTAIRRRFRDLERVATIQEVTGLSSRNLLRLHNGSLDAALVIESPDLAQLQSVLAFEVRPTLLLPAEHDFSVLTSVNLARLRGLRVAIANPTKDRYDFDRTYGQFFLNGIEPVAIGDGATAVLHHASTDRLAMISLRPVHEPPPTGFVRIAVADVTPTRFMLTRKEGSTRSLANRFWRTANFAIAEEARVQSENSTAA